MDELIVCHNRLGCSSQVLNNSFYYENIFEMPQNSKEIFFFKRLQRFVLV